MSIKRILFYALLLAQASSSSAVIVAPLAQGLAIPLEEHPGNPVVKFFYTQCAQLPTTPKTERLLYKNIAKKNGLRLDPKTSRGSSTFATLVSRKRSVTTTFTHPDNKKSFVVQVTFLAHQPTTQPAQRKERTPVARWTDVRIYGTEENCPEDVEAFVEKLLPSNRIHPLLKTTFGGITLLGIYGFYADHKKHPQTQASYATPTYTPSYGAYYNPYAPAALPTQTASRPSEPPVPIQCLYAPKNNSSSGPTQRRRHASASSYTYNPSLSIAQNAKAAFTTQRTIPAPTYSPGTWHNNYQPRLNPCIDSIITAQDLWGHVDLDTIVNPTLQGMAWINGNKRNALLVLTTSEALVPAIHDFILTNKQALSLVTGERAWGGVSTTIQRLLVLNDQAVIDPKIGTKSGFSGGAWGTKLYGCIDSRPSTEIIDDITHIKDWRNAPRLSSINTSCGLNLS